MRSNDLLRGGSCSYVKIASRTMKSLLRYCVNLWILGNEIVSIAPRTVFYEL